MKNIVNIYHLESLYYALQLTLIMPQRACNPGSSIYTNELSKEQVCVLGAIDRKGHPFNKIVTLL